MFNDTNLIVGSGITGAVLARNIVDTLGEKVLIIDKKNHIGGNCYDYKDDNGITIHKYGSHILHTNNERVWKFLSRFSDFNTYMHKVFAVIDGIMTTIPFNLNSLYDVFPNSLASNIEKKLIEKFEYNSKIPILEFQKLNDKDLNFLSEYVYKNVFLNYTIKQWGIKPSEIDSSVTSRVPIIISKDNRYFQDKYQGIPLKGYTMLIKNMLNHPDIEIKNNSNYKEFKNFEFKRIFYTGSIDEFFDYKLGILPYRSVYFKTEEYKIPYYQNNSVVNYPNNYDFTRVHEFKYYLNELSDVTVISKEYSQNFKVDKNDRYYPILQEKNINLYNQYKHLAEKIDNVWFLGRLGDYKYYDIDKAVERAFECFDEIFNNKMTLTLSNIMNEDFKLNKEEA